MSIKVQDVIDTLAKIPPDAEVIYLSFTNPGGLSVMARDLTGQLHYGVMTHSDDYAVRELLAAVQEWQGRKSPSQKLQKEDT